MNIICTLFEGHYHYGFAALVNSLFNSGFEGDIYAGYRGNLPNWAAKAYLNNSIDFPGASTLVISENCNIQFLPVITDFHFTNFKPYFLLDVFERLAPDAKSLFYFDPDITNLSDWSFYEEWVDFGVALVHEISWNDMPSGHPKRFKWARLSNAMGLEIKNNLNSYLNAGFVGVNRKNVSFLHLWKDMIDYAIVHLNFIKEGFAQSNIDTAMFKAGDQDIFNLAAMCTNCTLSEFGPDGMGFLPGGWLMLHSTGSPKPWKVNFFKQWLNGIRPSVQHVDYWKNTQAPIQLYTGSVVKTKLFYAKLYSFLSRFYGK